MPRCAYGSAILLACAVMWSAALGGLHPVVAAASVAMAIAQGADPLETPMHCEWARNGEEMLRPYSANAHLAS